MSFGGENIFFESKKYKNTSSELLSDNRKSNLLQSTPLTSLCRQCWTVCTGRDVREKERGRKNKKKESCLIITFDLFLLLFQSWKKGHTTPVESFPLKSITKSVSSVTRLCVEFEYKYWIWWGWMIDEDRDKHGYSVCDGWRCGVLYGYHISNLLTNTKNESKWQ